MNFSLRRIRSRFSLIQGKIKLGVSFILCTIFVLLVDHFLGLIAIILEKDFESDFSYPLDVDNFPALIENFRNGEAVDYEPVNRLYSRPSFLEKADSSCEKFQLMIILVKSGTTNFKNRAAIRQTWGHPQYLRNISNHLRAKKLVTNSRNNKFSQASSRHLQEPNVYFKLVFLVGLLPNEQSLSGEKDTSYKIGIDNAADADNVNYSKTREGTEARKRLEEDLQKEIREHKDVVRIETIDTYTNNTFKTMMGIRWASEICTDFEYALLVDDDMYISVKNLLLFLESPATYPDGEDSESESVGQIVDANRLFAGKVLFTKPIRQRLGASSKWYLSLDEYPYNYFPRYMPAAAIVMSKQVVDDFYYASYYTKHFRFDDVFLGIMAHKMNIIPFSCSYFHVCHTEDGKCTGLVSTVKTRRKGFANEDDYVNAEDLSLVEQMENVIARHGLNSEQLIDLWRELTLSGRT